MRKNIKLLLLAPILLGLLAGCDQNNNNTSTSNNYIYDWTESDLLLMNDYLGEGNIIPFDPSLFYTSISLDTSSSQVSTSNYLLTYYFTTNVLALTYETASVEIVDDYYNFVLTNYGETFVIDNELQTASSEQEKIYYLYKQLDNTSTINSRFYLNIYYDYTLSCLTVDAYIDTNYLSTSWPNQNNQDAILISDLLMLDREYASLFEFEPMYLNNVSYACYMFNGYPYVDIDIHCEYNTSHDEEDVSIACVEDFISQLLAKNYLLDSANSTTEYDDYYQIIYDEDNEPLFAIDCYVSTYSSPSNNTWKFNVLFYISY